VDDGFLDDDPEPSAVLSIEVPVNEDPMTGTETSDVVFAGHEINLNDFTDSIELSDAVEGWSGVQGIEN
jgi:hypothetical protein